MPYISLNLMVPQESSKVQHQLTHDLESLFLVFLHVIRFLSAPSRDIAGDNNRKKTHQIARWHHEPDVEIMFTDKKSDLRDLYIKPELYITEYWRPIAPYLKRLFEAMYPDIQALYTTYTSSITVDQFVSILTEARDHCDKLSEKGINYARVLAPAQKKRPSTTDLHAGGKAKKSRKTGVPKGQLDQGSEQPNTGGTAVGRFSGWKDSSAT